MQQSTREGKDLNDKKTCRDVRGFRVRQNVTAPCPCCGSIVFRTLNLLREASVEQCAGCKAIFADYGICHGGSGYERMDRRAYDRSIGAMRRGEASRHAAVASDLLYTGGKKRWLDIGAGAGLMCAEAQKQGFAVVAIEPDPAAQAMIRQLTRSEVVSSIAELPQSEYDVVSMLDVLEHIAAEDAGQLAQSVRALLRDNGLWVVKVPSSDGVFYRTAVAAKRLFPGMARLALERLWLVAYRSPHRMYFNEDNLGLFLSRNGFCVVFKRYDPTLTIQTILDRLTLDPTIPRWKACAMAPVALILRCIEKARGRTDSLVMVARKR